MAINTVGSNKKLQQTMKVVQRSKNRSARKTGTSDTVQLSDAARNLQQNSVRVNVGAIKHKADQQTNITRRFIRNMKYDQKVADNRINKFSRNIQKMLKTIDEYAKEGQRLSKGPATKN
jgi:hypothetical protein